MPTDTFTIAVTRNFLFLFFFSFFLWRMESFTHFSADEIGHTVDFYCGAQQIFRVVVYDCIDKMILYDAEPEVCEACTSDNHGLGNHLGDEYL